MTAFTDEELRIIAETVTACAGVKTEAAKMLGVSTDRVRRACKRAAERGMLGTKPVLDGFRISSITTSPNGTHITQKPERGETFTVPEGQRVKGISALVDHEDRVALKWIKTGEDSAQTVAWREALEEFKEALPRVPAVAGPTHVNSDLCVQYTLTDAHIGMLADAEETGDADYDLKIAEKLLTDWFSAAVAMSPSAGTAVFAQLGDLLHYDSMRSETPEHVG